MLKCLLGYRMLYLRWKRDKGIGHFYPASRTLGGAEGGINKCSQRDCVDIY